MPSLDECMIRIIILSRLSRILLQRSISVRNIRDIRDILQIAEVLTLIPAHTLVRQIPFDLFAYAGSEFSLLQRPSNNCVAHLAATVGQFGTVEAFTTDTTCAQNSQPEHQ